MAVSWYFFPSPCQELDTTVPLRAPHRHRGELQRRRRLVTAATSTTPSSLAGSATVTSLPRHCREERRLPGPEKLAIAIAGRSTWPYSSRQSGYSCIAWKGIKLRQYVLQYGSLHLIWDTPDPNEQTIIRRTISGLNEDDLMPS